MDWFLIVLGIILLLSSVTLAVSFYKEFTDTEGGIFGLGVFLMFGFICGLMSLCLGLYNSPTALDVYRGKTTLEITYRDSVAVDSTVVYKVR